MTDKREHSQLLKEIIPTLEGRTLPQAGERLMVLGSENDDVEFINLVEGLGATFVVDDHCTGSRYFWNEVEPQDDRLMAIADRYIKRPPCPTKDWPDRNRIKHVMQLAKDYNVQGAILLQQKFCDPHELDIPALRKSFNEANIPTLFLELDVTVPVGQFKIRSEAFLEMLREEDLF
jgi:benzoyl-CoA reductase subunit C